MKKRQENRNNNKTEQINYKKLKNFFESNK